MAHKDSQKQVFLNMRVTPEFRRRFKTWCAANDRDMTEVTIELIEKMLDSHKSSSALKKSK